MTTLDIFTLLLGQALYRMKLISCIRAKTKYIREVLTPISTKPENIKKLQLLMVTYELEELKQHRRL